MKYQAKYKKLSVTNTKLFLKIMKFRHRDLRLYALCSVLSAFVFMIFTCWGCATAKTSSKLQESTVITGIEVQDNTVMITANKPFIYTMYKPGDPYKVIVDLPDVATGTFNKKIMANKAGITEITPSQIEMPSMMARLEILLQLPSSVEQEYKNSVLTIKIKEDAAKKEDTFRKVNTTDVLKDEGSVSAKRDRYNPDLTGQTSLPKATEISSISFDTYGDTVKVKIKGNGSIVPNVFPLDDRIVIDIADVVMTAPLPSEVVSPVTGIRSGKHEDKVRLVLDLKEKTNFDVTAIGDSIVVTLKTYEKESSLLTKAVTSGEKPEAATEPSETKEPAPKVNGRCNDFLEGKENVNFDFQDQDIVPILRLFADISECNLFIHPDVKGKATMKFKNVPWDQALDTLLRTFGLGKAVEGNIIRVSPYTVFAKESDDKAKAAAAYIKAEPLETRIYPISYADVALMEASLRNSKVLSDRGSISVDKRTSSMLIKDITQAFPGIEELLTRFDKPTQQVLIEARIIEVDSTAERDLGIQWGINMKASNGLAALGGLSGIPGLLTGPVTGGNYLIDFPSKGAGPTSGSGITFGILNPARTIGLDMQISAVATAGKLKIVSSPRVMTVDNGKAKILQGKSIPVRQQTSEGTVSTVFKDVTLELNVTPHITPDKSVSMLVDIKKEDLDPTVPSIDGVPGTDKKEANTNVIIKDGETIVIGGLYKINTLDSEAGVPGLMNIPILGWLFKQNVKASKTSELLIFITPRIVVNQ